MPNVNINAGETTSIRLKETTVPATPAAGYVRLFAKTDGIWFVDDAGAEFGPFLPSTLAAAKGDLIAATAADAFGVLTAGTNDYVLTADDGEATGLKWAAAAAGGDVATDAIWDAAGDLAQGTGANTAARLPIGTANQLLRTNSAATAAEWASVGRVLISEQTPTGTGTVTWSSIPATYKTLEIEWTIRTDRVANTAIVFMYFNNDTTATNYRSTQTGSAATAQDSSYLALTPGTGALADTASVGIIKIFDYASTTFFKDAEGTDHYRLDATTVRNYQTSINWENTDAINLIDIITEGGNYIAGTTFRLYGVY